MRARIILTSLYACVVFDCDIALALPINLLRRKWCADDVDDDDAIG